MSQKRLVIYDLDGTLVDTGEDIAQAANYMLQEMAVPPLSLEKVRQLVGKGLHDLVQRCLQTTDEAAIARGLQLFGDYYGHHLVDHSRLYPGVKETLEYFQARSQAVVTNKPQPFAGDLLIQLDIAGYFREIVAVGGGYPKKPDPTAIRSLMGREGIRDQETLFIGDSLIDIETGRNAGVLTVIVTHGFADYHEVVAAQPDALVGNFHELLTLAKVRRW